MQYARVEINPDVMYGKPVIRGTRVPVRTVLRKLGARMPPEAIIVDHPRLRPDDILAAQAFAADYFTDARLKLPPSSRTSERSERRFGTHNHRC